MSPTNNALLGDGVSFRFGIREDQKKTKGTAKPLICIERRRDRC